MIHPAHGIRAFIAVSLPGQVKALLARMQNRLKNAGIQASWPRPETFHLTMKFMGDIPASSLPAIKACMEQAVESSAPIEMNAGSMGVFPTTKRPRVIWAGIHGQTHLLEIIYRNLENCLNQEACIPIDTRAFSPHITLARVKRRPEPDSLNRLMQDAARIGCQPFLIKSLDLYQSCLSSSGAVHTKLFRIKFGRCDSSKQS